MAWRRRRRSAEADSGRLLPTQHWQDARPLGEGSTETGLAAGSPPAEEAPNPVILLPVGLFAAALVAFCLGAVMNETFLLGGAGVLFVMSVFALFAVPLLRMLQDQQPRRR